jgi:hypothetical protein
VFDRWKGLQTPLFASPTIVLTAILHVLLQHFLRGEELHEVERGGSQVAVQNMPGPISGRKLPFNNAVDSSDTKKKIRNCAIPEPLESTVSSTLPTQESWLSVFSCQNKRL